MSVLILLQHEADICYFCAMNITAWEKYHSSDWVEFFTVERRNQITLNLGKGSVCLKDSCRSAGTGWCALSELSVYFVKTITTNNNFAPTFS